jgi:hypothetical protein
MPYLRTDCDTEAEIIVLTFKPLVVNTIVVCACAYIDHISYTQQNPKASQ